MRWSTEEAALQLRGQPARLRSLARTARCPARGLPRVAVLARALRDVWRAATFCWAAACRRRPLRAAALRRSCGVAGRFVRARAVDARRFGRLFFSLVAASRRSCLMVRRSARARRVDARRFRRLSFCCAVTVRKLNLNAMSKMLWPCPRPSRVTTPWPCRHGDRLVERVEPRAGTRGGTRSPRTRACPSKASGSRGRSTTPSRCLHHPHATRPEARRSPIDLGRERGAKLHSSS
jgi:hypothetical protein